MASTARRYLIDGYNLLHAIGLPAKIGPGTLHHARARLVALAKKKHPHDELTIVFDAQHAPPGVPRERYEDGVHIRFANGSADDLIRDLVAHDSAPRSLWVVTGDREIQEAVRRRGARVIDTLPFLDDIVPTQPIVPPTSEKPTSSADAETRHWLEAFGTIDAEAEVQNLQRIEPMNPDPAKVKKHRGRPKNEDPE